MKIAIFSDLHLGMQNYGYIMEDGIHSRVRDFEFTYNTFIDYCIENGVGLVIFGGDAFKNRNAPPYQLVMFIKGIERLREEGIEVLVVAGNHDKYKTKGYNSILEVLDVMDNVAVVIDKPEVWEIKGVPILCIPYLYDTEFKNLDYEDMEDLVDDLASNLWDGTKALGIGHFGVEGARLGGEQGLMVGKDMALSKSLFTKYPDVDWFLGHYHRHQEVAENITYVGSMDRVDFGECNEKKGFIIGDWDSEEGFDSEFVENPVREFHKITLKVEDYKMKYSFEDIFDKFKDTEDYLWIVIECKKTNKSKAIALRKRFETAFADNSTMLTKVDIETEDRGIKKEFGDVKLSNIHSEINNHLENNFKDRYKRLKKVHESILEGSE